MPVSAPGSPSTDTDLARLTDLVNQSRYEEVLDQGQVWLDSLSSTDPGDLLLEARILDLMVNAGYRGERVMEEGFLDMASRAVALNEANAGPESLPTATSLMHQANLLNRRGDRAEAIPRYERAIHILATLGPEYDSRRAVLLSSEGVALRAMGEYGRAAKRYEEALVIQETNLGPDHPDLATTLNNLGVIRRLMGDYRQAREMYHQALVIREAHFGPQHEWVAESLNNLAAAESYLGSYDEALRLQERAVEVFRVSLGEDHQRYWWARLNLGISYLDMGDHDGALPICEEVLAAIRRIYGHDHIETTYALDALASCHYQAGRFDQALALYSESLQVIEKTLGVDNPEGGPTMFEVGRCQVAQGRVEEGAATMSRSLAIQEEAAGKDSSDLCDLLHQLAEAQLMLGRPPEALGFARRSREILFAEVGSEHPLYAEAILLEARALAAEGQDDQAVDLALTAEDISRRHLQATMRVLSEARALDYAVDRVRGLDVALSLLPMGEPSDRVNRAWDSVIRSRATVLDEFIARNTGLNAQTDPAAAALLDSSLTLRERISNLSLRGPGYQDPTSYRNTLDRLRQDLDQLDRQLSLVDSRVGQARRARELGQADVMAGLPDGSALISYVLYRRADGSLPPGESEDHFMAIVAARGLPGPVAVELGPARGITDLISEWRNQIRFGSSRVGEGERESTRGLVRVAGKEAGSLDAYLDAAMDLREAVWDPLAGLVGDRNMIFLVPDGALHLVNFCAFPADEEGFLAESGPVFHTLMTERSVVTLNEPGDIWPGIMAIGDPDFGISPVDGDTRGTPWNSAAGSAPCAELTRIQFQPLPHAREEVDQLAVIWRSNGDDDRDDVHILSGAEATESAFKGEMGRHGVLHLATHGFVLTDDCTEGSAGASGRTHILNMSGLALAGANDWAMAEAGSEDGILTAAEISALDMTGVNWAVLSACNTGLGDLTTRSEGVFGLCRAFSLAGARTVIVSLWPVGDESTRSWMKALYTFQQEEGMSTAQAIRRSNQMILAQRRAAGLSTHPYFWAGFTAVGDWQ